jgi:hypothetical protein
MLVGARYYDAQVGRFISRDTDLDQLPYLYCDHDPVNAVDPSGHLPSWLRKVINYGEDVLIGGCGAVAIALIPVEAPAIVVIGAGAIIGGFVGGAISGNDYYWDHPDLSTWDPDEFNWNVERGALNGGFGGAIMAPSISDWMRRWLFSGPPPGVGPITRNMP